MSLPGLPDGIGIMKEDPLDAVYAYVERAYVRLQAGDLLIRCLEAGSSAPIQHMVEDLVLAGPQSLSVLREMLAESSQRKSQVLDDLYQVLSDFETSINSFGVQLSEMKDVDSLIALSSSRFQGMMDEQGIRDDEVQIACVHILRNSRDLLSSLNEHIDLLVEIEDYLEDWMWALAYQFTRERLSEGRSYPASKKL
jgi:hypothetical protein